MSDPGLDQHVRLNREDQLLHADQVFRELDDGPPKPAERIDILLVPTGPEPSAGYGRKTLSRIERKSSRAMLIADGHAATSLVYCRDPHGPPRSGR